MIEKLKDTSVKKVAVVGAGYIGVELAEAFKRNGREVVLIDLADTCLSGYYDREFSDRMAHNLQEHGVKLAFGEKVVRLEGGRRVERVVTDQGCYEADMVVFGIGFKPNTALGQGRLRTFGKWGIPGGPQAGDKRTWGVCGGGLRYGLQQCHTGRGLYCPGYQRGALRNHRGP